MGLPERLRSSTAISDLAHAYLVNGRCEEAHAVLDKLRGVEPPVLFSLANRSQCLAQEGRWEEAIAVLRGGIRAGGPTMLAQLGLTLGEAARAGASSGRDPAQLVAWEAEARAILESLREHARLGTATSFDLGRVYVGLGEIDLAFDYFEQAVEDRSLRFDIMHPRYRVLHEHPRFQTLLSRLGIPPR